MTGDARQLVEAFLRRPGYTSAVGTRIEFAEVGRVALALERKPELVQFHGFFHGGVIAGLADTAAGAAVSTALPQDKIGITVSLQLNFLAPADGTRVVASAKLARLGSTISTATVEIGTLRDGTLHRCALATAILRAVDRPQL